MKAVFLLVTLVLGQQAFAQNLNCKSPSMKYRKVPNTYSNSIGHQLACQAVITGETAISTDINVDSLACEKGTALYEQVGHGRKFCAILVNKTNGAKKYLQVEVVQSAEYTAL